MTLDAVRQKRLAGLLGLRPVVVGLGKSGLAAKSLVEAAKVSGVKVFDDLPDRSDFSSPEELLLSKPSILIVSPGYPLSRKWIQKAQSQGIPISSELLLSLDLLNNETLIGVTGSVGKSSVVTWITNALKSAGQSVGLWGNIGEPFSNYHLQPEKNQFLVLELSSYQLEILNKSCFDYSVITNFYKNHMDRYESCEDYHQSKWNLVEATKQKSFLNKNSKLLWDFSLSHPVKTKLGWVNSQRDQKNPKFGHLNEDNVALTLELLKELGFPVPDNHFSQVFSSLEHRQEVLKNRYCTLVNDSKSTSIESVLSAWNIFKSSDDLHLLLGGRDKGLEWKALSMLRETSETTIHVFGEHAKHLGFLCGENSLKTESLKKLLEELPQKLTPQSTVLLSPGGSSLDEFESFEERGWFFKKWGEILENLVRIKSS